jgi:hypothetical protein
MQHPDEKSARKAPGTSEVCGRGGPFFGKATTGKLEVLDGRVALRRAASRRWVGARAGGPIIAKAGRSDMAKATKQKSSEKSSAKKLARSSAADSESTKREGKDDEAKSPSSSKRKLGLRGAAPWAARHAAKHAAEARARAAEPAPPGSARATLRVPQGAEEIKAKIGELHNQTQKIRALRKRMERDFFELGLILGEIQEGGLYVAKGFGSFEAFLEREIDLGKQVALGLIKIARVFQREAALDYGLDRLLAAIAVLDGAEAAPKAAASTPATNMNPLPLPMKPPMRVAGG